MCKQRIIISVLIVFISLFVRACFLSNNISIVVAGQINDVEYSYDDAGRLSMVTYSDGEQIEYEYDINGNVTVTKVIPKEKDKEDSNDNVANDNNDSDKITENENNSNLAILRGKGYVYLKTELRQLNILHETPQEKQAYNKIKKKKPILKSIKPITKKNKKYLKVQVREISGLGNYSEHGYEVKYATNKNFKKAKTIRFQKKGSITGKQWSVKKGKTYWVKVRAYVYTKKGKTIYSKYSKSVRVKVN